MNSSGVSRALHHYAILTAGATFLLLMAGALVVGYEAGLAVPDWPLSFGTWMPPMVGGILYEHGHRMIAGTVGVLTTALVIWIWWKEPRRWVKGLGLAAWVAVVAQAILGGLTVLYRLPVPIVIAHGCLAQAFFCLVLSLALVTSPAWERAAEAAEEPPAPDFWHLAAAATAALFIQLALGAALRHKALGLGPHWVWAGVAGFLVGWVCYRAVTELEAKDSLRKLAKWLGGILALQVVLGVASYAFRAVTQGIPEPRTAVVLITSAHLATGALLLGCSLLVTLLAYRRVAAAGKVASFAGDPQRTFA